MAVKKLSQITAAGRVSDSTDFLVGVDSGNNDLLFIGGNRTILTADTTYFIRTTGNDSTGNGLTSGTAWATLQHAMDTLAATVDGGGFTVTFDIGAGTFSGMGFIEIVGLTFLYLNGAGASSTIISGGVGPSSINQTESFSAYNPLSYAIFINNMQIGDVGSVGCITAFSNQVIWLCSDPSQSGGGTVSYVISGVTNNGVHCETGSTVVHAATGTVNVSVLGASVLSWLHAVNFGYIESGATVTLTGSPNFSFGLVSAARNAEIELETTCTFSGASGGASVRFVCADNSIIDTFNRGLNFIPGSIAGTIGAGGVYK